LLDEVRVQGRLAQSEGKMKYGMFFVSAATALSACATVQDTFRDSRLSSSFTKFDDDSDGVISTAEAQDADGLRQNFQRLDTNRSGGISKEEYDAATVDLVDVDFNAADVNRDGVINEREAGATPVSLREAFRAVDSDRDGNVSSVEYQAARTNLLQEVSFEALDRDGDRVISRIEADEVPELSEGFRRADLDSDGLLNADEFRATQR
jgi:Ca2+-binding EF-hand superfamily protein